jgi:hypothetical protein
VKLESTKGWRRQKARIKATENKSLTAIDKCLTKMPNMRVHIRENGGRREQWIQYY